MKILIAMDGFFPGKKYGGPPVSIENFCTLMSDEECYIVTKNHDLGDKVAYTEVVSGKWVERKNCNALYLSDNEYTMKKFEKIILEVHPDLIYVQSLFDDCVIFWLLLAMKHNIKVLLAPRGQLCAGAMKKKYKKLPYIFILRMLGCLKNVYCQSTSLEETEAIYKYLKVDRTKILFLTNIPSVVNVLDDTYVPKNKGKANLIFLSRIHPKKNLLSAISFLMHIKGNVKLDVYGSIEDKSYWKMCQQKVNMLPKTVEVCYKGLVAHEKVHETFSSYDAFIFPTHSENYGHVIAEALQAGCPVIISDQTPWQDLEKYDAGWVCRLECEREFQDAIQAVVNIDSNKYKEGAKEYAKRKIGLESLKLQYEDTLRKIVCD